MIRVRRKMRAALKPGLFIALLLALVGVAMLSNAAAVSQGIRDGLAVCGSVLIPSLFPFMVLSGFISRSDYARILSFPLTPITTKVFKLPARYGVVVLLGLVGGYPVGARMVAGLLENGEIDEKTAGRMLCFCVNSGPSFLISAVGVGMLMSKTAGVILFACQTAATLLVGAVVSFRKTPPSSHVMGKYEKGGIPAFVNAVAGASSGMLTMCAFAILFSAALSLVRASGIIASLAMLLPVKENILNAVICGFLEVTAGCLGSAAVGGEMGFALMSVCASFCGLSVIFQVMSCFGNRKISFFPFICARLAHAILSTAIALPLYRLLCDDIAVWSTGAAPFMQGDEKNLMISFCLIVMCSILVLCAGIDRR